MATETIELSGLDGGTVFVSSDQLGADVLRPGDEGWDASVLIWNGMVAKEPAAVVRPGSAAEVVAAVRLAADKGLLLSVKGGGHNIAGTSMAEGGLTLDMSRMQDVTVDQDAALVHVGPGCLIKHVDAATQARGLATTLGFVSETGVAGLTLGGGFGYLTRRFGWTIDSLTEVEIVTADGEVRTANRDENSDLFWAIRGGGGNLGVVTRFSLRLYPLKPTITGGMILWGADRVDEVLATYRQVSESAPRELTLVSTVRLAPPAPFIPPEWHGKPVVGMVLCHTGANPMADLAPIRALGDPIIDLVMEKPYAAQQSMLDATQPKGMHYYWKSDFVSALPDGLLDAYKQGGLSVTSPMSQAVLFHLEGALNTHAEDDGAVGNRDAKYVLAFNAMWPPPDPRSAEHVAWARESLARCRPFTTGGNYVNFQVADDGGDRTAAAYRGNFERLQQVKATYDPGNLFRVNRNVSPAGAS